MGRLLFGVLRVILAIPLWLLGVGWGLALAVFYVLRGGAPARSVNAPDGLSVAELRFAEVVEGERGPEYKHQTITEIQPDGQAWVRDLTSEERCIRLQATIQRSGQFTPRKRLFRRRS